MSASSRSASGLGEFDLIDTYFSNLGPASADVLLSVGDDCALIAPPLGKQLCLSVDTLVEGVHFPHDFPPDFIAQRALGSAVSDLAAMGAHPSHFSLALTLPRVDRLWLERFTKGLAESAQRHQISLVGGDTTSGPLTISLQVHGWVDAGMALRRDGANAGDGVYVSGWLGLAAAGLGLTVERLSLSDHALRQRCLERFCAPEARLELGSQLLGRASACIDISDGLLADARHLCEASFVSMLLDVECLPLATGMSETFGEQAVQMALSGGDDYELLFTVPEAHQDAVETLASEACRITKIGRVIDTQMTEGRPQPKVFEGERTYQVEKEGYQHFV